MRFIGGKTLLLEHISDILLKIKDPVNSFCDLFAGSGVVSRYFKPKYKIISNDMLYFSYVLQNATIQTNNVPVFSALKSRGISNVWHYLSSGQTEGFISKNYAPNHINQRMYFSRENAAKIDFARTMIGKWKGQNLLNAAEYYYLIACLIEAVPFVSNITGTYGAYLKHWDSRATKMLQIQPIDVVDNKQNNLCFNEDANKLVRKITGDVLYIDPPYNSRQYLPNYHILETIAKYDSPKIYGKTGLRPYDDQKSKYCDMKEVVFVFEDLIKNANFKHLILSYSTEGLMTESDIEKILKDYGKKETYRMQKISYRRYKGGQIPKEHDLRELLFYVEKKS